MKSGLYTCAFIVTCEWIKSFAYEYFTFHLENYDNHHMPIQMGMKHMASGCSYNLRNVLGRRDSVAIAVYRQ